MLPGLCAAPFLSIAPGNQRERLQSNHFQPLVNKDCSSSSQADFIYSEGGREWEALLQKTNGCDFRKHESELGIEAVQDKCPSHTENIKIRIKKVIFPRNLGMIRWDISLTLYLCVWKQTSSARHCYSSSQMLSPSASFTVAMTLRHRKEEQDYFLQFLLQFCDGGEEAGSVHLAKATRTQAQATSKSLSNPFAKLHGRITKFMGNFELSTKRVFSSPLNQHLPITEVYYCQQFNGLKVPSYWWLWNGNYLSCKYCSS